MHIHIHIHVYLYTHIYANLFPASFGVCRLLFDIQLLYISSKQCKASRIYTYIHVHIYSYLSYKYNSLFSVSFGICRSLLDMHLSYFGSERCEASRHVYTYLCTFAKEPYKRDDILQKRPMI